MKIRSALFWSFTSLLTVPWMTAHLDAQPFNPPPGPVTRLDAPSPPPGQAGNILAEVEKMVTAGADPNVIKAFVQNWTSRFSLSADDILHLHDIGVSSDVLTTLIRRSAELQAAQTMPGQPQYPNAASPGPMSPPPGTYSDMASTNPPAYIYPYPATTPAYTYSYLYPYSSYPLLPSYSYYSYPYYWPSLSFYYSWPGYRYGYRPWYGYRGYYRGYSGFYGHGGYYGHGGFSRGGFGHGRR